MKKCIKCGHELADEAVFCHICGERQVPGESPSVNTQSIADNTRQAVKEEKSVLSCCFSACLKIIIASFCVVVLYIITSNVFAYSKMKGEFSPTTVTKELPAKTVPKRTSLEWSKRSRKAMKWAEAVNYCKNLNENGYSDWRLPTISELRTLIEHCPGTQTGGKCSVTDNCLSYEDCYNAPCGRGCYFSLNGDHSRFGDIDFLWSSSVRSDDSNRAWTVDFYNGYVSFNIYKDGYSRVRCVR